MKTLREQLAEYERLIIQRAIGESPTRVVAAQRLGVSLRTLFYKMEKYGIGSRYEYERAEDRERRELVGRVLDDIYAETEQQRREGNRGHVQNHLRR